MDPTCVYCGEQVEGASWYVSGLLAHHPRQGQAHGTCVPWEKEHAPYGHLIRELPRDAAEMRIRQKKGVILKRCIQRMHAEWPLRARSRVEIVERLLRDYRGY